MSWTGLCTQMSAPTFLCWVDSQQHVICVCYRVAALYLSKVLRSEDVLIWS